MLFASVALAITAVALYLDLVAWNNGRMSDTLNWRFARTVSCAVAAAGVAYAPVRSSDRWLVPLALLLAVVADYFLVLRHDLITGIGLFAIMQTLLILRHLQGVRLNDLLQRSMLLPVLIAVVILVVGNLMLWPALAPKGLAVPVLIYGGLLMVSVLAAHAAGQAGKLPRPQAMFALVGMVLFLLCDVTVGIGAAYGDTPNGQLIRALTGLFYTPSLLLIVRSGMR